MRIEDFLRYFDRVKRSGDGFTVRCPGHDDKHNSLSIGSAPDEKILVKCHAGCETEHIVRVLGLTMAALMPERAGEQEVATYDYRDEKGGLLYQVVRYYPKTFKQRRPDGGGGWYWKVEGVRRVPYRLPEILASAADDRVVFIVEGEKDADRLARMGEIATTNAGGAGKWLDTMSEHFEGRYVAILPDNDETGMKHAEQVKASLARFNPKQVEIIKLPGLPPKGDVSDWYIDEANTKEKFDEIVERAFAAEVAEREAIQEEQEIAYAETAGKKSWTPLELVRNSAIGIPEGFLHRAIFPRGTVSTIMGPSSSGKSYFVKYLGAAIALGGDVHDMATRAGRVLFLSCEMNNAELKYRSAEVWDEATREKLHPNRFQFRSEFNDEGETLDFGADDAPVKNPTLKNFLTICAAANKPDVVIIDSLKRVHHRKENDNREMGIVMATLELAARWAHVAIIVIHHFGKASEFRTGMWRGRGASVIIDYSNDVLTVENISKTGEPKSVVKFEKTRSMRKSPPPFIFTQEKTGRRETILGETIECVTFATTAYTETEKPRSKPVSAADEHAVSSLADRIEVEIRKAAAKGERLNTRQIIQLIGAKTGATIVAIQGLKAQGVIEGEAGPKNAILWGLKVQPKTEPGA